MVCILLLFSPVLLITVHGRFFFNVVIVSSSDTTSLDFNWTLVRTMNDGSGRRAAPCASTCASAGFPSNKLVGLAILFGSIKVTLPSCPYGSERPSSNNNLPSIVHKISSMLRCLVLNGLHSLSPPKKIQSA